MMVTLIPFLASEGMSTPTYKNYSIQGFTVLFNQELLNHQQEADEAREELKLQLKKIRSVIPPEPLLSLEKVQIWMEWDKKHNIAAQFHISAKWLRENGNNPQKAGGIEISNTSNFIQWSRAEQPWMVLHELSHAYHFLVLGESYHSITAAYQQAVNHHLYEDVDYINGGKTKAYALSNASEYFAELSEAYFGKNDFYPFTRQQLAEYDPVGFQLMQKAWVKSDTGDFKL
jgi:hypothetical protein